MATTDTRLVLIRHGESQAQVDGRVSGHDTCTGLSEWGRHQTALLRDRLQAGHELADADAVYTSVLARSIETAAILGPGIGAGPAPQAECDWCEIHAGEADGMTFDELRQHDLTNELDVAFHRRMPGAESWVECYARLGARLRRVARDHPGQCVVVVGHGGTVGASFVALGDLPLRRGAALTHATVNTSITEWRWASGDWQLQRYNDAAHLGSPLPEATA